MTTELSTPYSDLFYNELIQSYMQNPRFVAHPWLANRVDEALADPNCRFLLLTAAPGVGKTTFMAWLAHQHPTTPRYFIRRDQRTPLGDPGAHSLLLQIGFQLAASHPTLFERKQLQVVIEQRIGEVSSSGEAIAADIEKMFASPFYQMVVQIRQQVECNNGKVTGIRIGEWITDPRLLPLSNLQYMALLDPARAMLKEAADKPLVILIDALDELRYRDPEQTLLSWLATCPELPANVRFVLSSRPDEALLARFRGAQQPWLKEVTIDTTDPHIQQGLRTYALRLTEEPEVKAALEGAGKKVDDFVNQAVEWASGNIGTLDAVGRAIDQALLQQDRQATLIQLLDLNQLPNTLEGLYAFFLNQLKVVATKGEKSIAVEDENGQVHYLSPWPTVYRPILGVLAVAREPLTTIQIQNLGAIQADWSDLCQGLDALRQFLNRSGESYSLYHATLIEFLTDQKTQQDPDTRDLYLSEREWHRKIATYYRRKAGEAGWNQVETYGLLHQAEHLYAIRDHEGLYGLVCAPFMKAKHIRFGSYWPFGSDVELVIKLAGSEEPCNLVQEIRGSLIYTTLGSLATNVPTRALRVLAEVGQWEKAKGYAMLMQSPWKQCDAFCQLGRASWLQKDVPEARLFFEQAVRAVQGIDDEGDRAIVLAQIAAQVSEDTKAVQIANQAIELALHMPNPRRSFTCGSVARALAQTDMVEQVRTVLGAIEDQERRSLVQVEMITTLIKEGHIGDAVQWPDTINDPWEKSLVQVGLALALIQAGRITQAVEIANNILMGIEAITDPLSESLLLAQVARAMSQAGENARATEVMNQALEVAEAITDQFQRPWVLSGVARSLARIGHVEQAMKLAESIGETDTSASASRARGKVLVEIAKALARAGEYDRALTLSTTAQDLGRAMTASGAFPVEYVLPDENIPSQQPDLAAVVAVVRDMAGAGLTEEALAHASAIDDQTLKSSALFEIACVLAQAGLVDKAVASAEAISGSTERAEALAAIAGLLMETGKREQALEIAEKAVVQTETVKDLWRESPAASSLVGVMIQAGQVDKALAVAETITKEKVQNLLIVAQAMVEGGKQRQGRELVEQALEQADQSADWMANLEAARILFQIGPRQQAEGLVDQVLSAVNAQDPEIQVRAIAALARLDQGDHAYKMAKAIANPWYGVPALAEVIKVFSRTGEGELAASVAREAIALAQSMGNSWAKGPVMAQLIAALAEAGLVDQALAALEEVNNGSDKISALAEVIKALGQKGEASKALEVARSALAEAEENRYPGDWGVMAKNLSKVIKALAHVDQCELISTIVDRAVNATAKVDDLRGQALTSLEVVEALVLVGDVGRALHMLESITNLKYKDVARAKGAALGAVAKALIKTGQKERAKDIVDQIEEMARAIEEASERAWLYVKATTILNEIGENELALSALRTALSFARSSNRYDLFSILSAAGLTLAAIDQCRTLWSIHQVLLEVDTWWSPGS